jgi:hypothetical protein
VKINKKNSFILSNPPLEYKTVMPTKTQPKKEVAANVADNSTVKTKSKNKSTKIAKEPITDNTEAPTEKVEKVEKVEKKTHGKNKTPVQEIQTGGEDSGTVVTRSEGPKREFNVVRILNHDGKEEDFKGGKYLSKTPQGAAKKVANQVCNKLYKDDPECTVDIIIKESSRKGSGKEYGYRAVRTPNDKKVPFHNGDREVLIGFKWNMNLKSLRRLADQSVNDKNTVDETEVATTTV